jgi:hypothetical protein
MSIALPLRRRCPAAKSGWVCLPKERQLSVLPAIVEFVTAPVTILLRASFLKREVQIFAGVLLNYGHGYPYFRAHDRVMIVLSTSTKPVTLVVRAVLSAIRWKKRKGGKHDRFPE